MDNDDATSFDALIAGERIVFTWGTGPFDGYIMTDSGTIVSFATATQSEGNAMLGIWIGIIILGGTTLMIASLLTSSSPKLSRWVTKMIGSEEERKSAIREERRLARKKGRA